MGPVTLETPAWLMRGVATVDATRGSLRLDAGRLSFRATGAQAPVFDVALAEVANVTFPFYSVGSVVRFDAAGTRRRVAFLASEPRSRWSGARLSDVRPARRWGKQWKAALGTGR